MARLLLIEDEVDLAHQLAHTLRLKGYAVDVALTGEEGLHQGLVYDYDLAILDLNLPDMDGLEVCRALRAQRPGLLILMLTARDAPNDRVQGLDAGGDDYLVKPFHLEELLARIRALLRRVAPVRTPVLRYRDLTLDPAAHAAWQGRRRLHLTRKEFAILEHLMRHPDRVISQEELLEHVWGQEVNPFTHTVRVHIRSLRRKLGDDPQRPRYIQTIIGKGYRLVPEEEP
ncbi:MAG: response regulator transcription factor [Chloroflexi bacterium]|nr:response regulator transcription factor [Chloroflexota bacterium]